MSKSKKQAPAKPTKPPRVNVPEGEAVAFMPSPYIVEGGRLCLRKQTETGAGTMPLCNFKATIVREVVKDDGLVRQTYFDLHGSLASGAELECIQVPSAQFGGMSWVIDKWGARAIIAAGNAIKDHLRCAIQNVSGTPARCVVYTHIGWRNIDGHWLYLHAGGAIGAAGSVPGIEVDLADKLRMFELPTPPQGEALKEAIRASLAMLTMAQDALIIPIFLAVYRAPLGVAPFTEHIVSQTQVGKSSLQGVAQAHWGIGFDWNHLPGNWESTLVALELLAFSIKDALFCIDDYAPSGSKMDRMNNQGVFDKIVRNQGNLANRNKGTDASTLHPSRVPRGLILSSGEDVSTVGSIRGRLMILEADTGMIDWDQVTQLQGLAQAGQLASAMAGYVQWLAPQMNSMSNVLKERLGVLRSGFHDAQKRTADQSAQLLTGGEHFLRYAEAAEAITHDEAEVLRIRFISALSCSAGAQAEPQSDSDPVNRFLEVLAAVFLSGRAHLEGTKTREPKNGARLGWVSNVGSLGGCERMPMGPRIGWEDSDAGVLYLDGPSCFAAVQALAGGEGEPLLVTRNTLWKRLRSVGKLEVEETDRIGKKTPGRGQGHRCVALRASAFWPNELVVEGTVVNEKVPEATCCAGVFQ